jgi:hypothetical protein
MLQMWLLTVNHEIRRGARSIHEELVPALTDRGDEPALDELDYLDLMHPIWESYRFWQANGLASIGPENRRARHGLRPHAYLFGIYMPLPT